MIEDYIRPASIAEAVSLLSDKTKVLKPLGGGTSISREKNKQFGVVDLQGLGLDHLEQTGQHIKAGAATKLKTFLGHSAVHPEIQRSILMDTTDNIRNAASFGGWLISSDGRSVFSTVMLALDASMTWEPGGISIQMGDWLPLRRKEAPGVLMTEVNWPVQPYVAFEYVARSPKDRPILIVAVAQWRSGRTRIALGGFGVTPIIAMDGPDDSGADVASRDAFYKAGDQWASAQYRREVVSTLAVRCLKRIKETKESEA
jgi:CO/xanthine dehydrogenase FAD-binding subunit